jgi:hypothetical protein
VAGLGNSKRQDQRNKENSSHHGDRLAKRNKSFQLSAIS